MLRKIGTFAALIVGAVFLAFAVVHFFLQTATVGGESMQPSYYDGDVILVDKLSYHIRQPKRYEAALIELESGTTAHYSLKRVIGLPGETVQITDGTILIDGKELSYQFDEEILSAGLAAYSVKLGDDEYFVMGDNCNNSEDSRFANVGNIQRSQFVGRASVVVKKSDNR